MFRFLPFAIFFSPGLRRASKGVIPVAPFRPKGLELLVFRSSF